MKLLVRNLARTTTETEIQTLFETIGKVRSCTLVMDEINGLSKGFGFVEMTIPADAKKAVQELNRKEFGGSIIRVKRGTS